MLPANIVQKRAEMRHLFLEASVSSLKGEFYERTLFCAAGAFVAREKIKRPNIGNCIFGKNEGVAMSGKWNAWLGV